MPRLLLHAERGRPAVQRARFAERLQQLRAVDSVDSLRDLLRSCPERPQRASAAAEPWAPDRIVKLAGGRRIKKASRRLCSHGAYPVDPEQALVALKAKYPPREVPVVALAPSLVEPLHLTPTTLDEAVRSAPPDSSPGPSGWTFCLFWAFLSPNGQELTPGLVALSRLANALLAGHLSAPAARVMAAGDLFALYKTDKCDASKVRPIAVTRAEVRLVARAACRALRAKFAELLAPHQFSVAVPTGCEAVHHLLEATLDVDLSPDECLLHLDVRNASTRCTAPRSSPP